MKLDTLEKLFEEQIKDIYSAENQILKALPRMMKKATSSSLKKALEHHLEETESQVDRLEALAQELEIRPGGKKCKAMQGLLEEGKELLTAKGNEAVIDCGIISAAQKVEHYEIAAYGTARTLAEQLGLEEAVNVLDEILEEEKEADKKLTEITLNEIMVDFDEGEYPDEQDEARV